MAVAFGFASHTEPIKCSLYYIDDKHKTEKPFFRIDEPFNAERLRTNIQINRHDDNIARDLRGLEHLLDFERDGLEIHKFKTTMTERATPKDALECYRSEIAALLHSRFKTETVVFYDCIVSFSSQPITEYVLMRRSSVSQTGTAGVYRTFRARCCHQTSSCHHGPCWCVLPLAVPIIASLTLDMRSNDRGLAIDS